MGTLFSTGCPLSPLMSPWCLCPAQILQNPPNLWEKRGGSTGRASRALWGCVLHLFWIICLCSHFFFRDRECVCGHLQDPMVTGREKMGGRKMRKIQFKSIGNATPQHQNNSGSCSNPSSPSGIPKKGKSSSHSFGFWGHFALRKGLQFQHSFNFNFDSNLIFDFISISIPIQFRFQFQFLF